MKSDCLTDINYIVAIFPCWPLPSFWTNQRIVPLGPARAVHAPWHATLLQSSSPAVKRTKIQNTAICLHPMQPEIHVMHLMFIILADLPLSETPAASSRHLRTYLVFSVPLSFLETRNSFFPRIQHQIKRPRFTTGVATVMETINHPNRTIFQVTLKTELLAEKK